MTNESTKFVLSNKMYEFGKKLVQVFIPAISSAYFGLASMWGLPSAEKVVGTLAILATFLGVTLSISNSQYKSSDAGFDGTVHVFPTEDGSTVSINVDPQDLVSKKSVTLKVKPPTVVVQNDPELLAPRKASKARKSSKKSI